MKRQGPQMSRTKNSHQELLDKLQELEGQIDIIRENILQNNAESKPKTRRERRGLTIEDYKTFFSWQDKIVFILKYRNKPLLSSEIVFFMDDFDTVFRYKQTTLEKTKMLSTHLTRAIKKGIITRFKQTGVRGYYYCLPENLNNYRKGY